VRTDTLAEEGREISDDNKRWDDRTYRMTFEVQKGNTTVRSVWTNSGSNAFRRQAGLGKLQEVRRMFSSKALDRTGVVLPQEPGYWGATFFPPEPWGNHSIVNRMGGFLPPGTMVPKSFFGLDTTMRPWEGL
jgi:hypothetical protein